MKHLEIPFLQPLHRTSPVEEVFASLNALQRHRIDNAPWPEYAYVPKVEFSIAHGKDCIFLKYYVEEEVVKASYYQPDDPVYKDSCVEFFIAFDGEAYYNLEFNALGTCKLNFGKNRDERVVISDKLVKTIRNYSTVKKAGSTIQWEMCLIIPGEVFSQHAITSFLGRSCKANFYKCGDDLPTPHFLCWNRVETPAPDFHAPKYFGDIMFL